MNLKIAFIIEGKTRFSFLNFAIKDPIMFFWHAAENVISLSLPLYLSLSLKFAWSTSYTYGTYVTVILTVLVIVVVTVISTIGICKSNSLSILFTKRDFINSFEITLSLALIKTHFLSFESTYFLKIKKIFC